MKLYHGTDKKAARKIKNTGFKKNECSDYGNAAYFSDQPDWAKEYAHKDGVIIEVTFIGNLLDLSNPGHFEIFRQNDSVIPFPFDALKDGNIIAVYNLKTLSLSPQ